MSLKLEARLRHTRADLEHQQRKIYGKIDNLERFMPHLSDDERGARLDRCDAAVDEIQDALDALGGIESECATSQEDSR